MRKHFSPYEEKGMKMYRMQTEIFLDTQITSRNLSLAK